MLPARKALIPPRGKATRKGRPLDIRRDDHIGLEAVSGADVDGHVKSRQVEAGLEIKPFSIPVRGGQRGSVGHLVFRHQVQVLRPSHTSPSLENLCTPGLFRLARTHSGASA